jgi:hypothetical protein
MQTTTHNQHLPNPANLAPTTVLCHGCAEIKTSRGVTSAKQMGVLVLLVSFNMLFQSPGLSWLVIHQNEFGLLNCR